MNDEDLPRLAPTVIRRRAAPLVKAQAAVLDRPTEPDAEDQHGAVAEITKADVDRVDAVDEPATGIPFLVLKTQTAPRRATKAERLKALETAAIAKAREAGVKNPSLTSLMVRKAQGTLPPRVVDLLNQIVAVLNALDDSSTGADQAQESPVDTGEGQQPENPAPSQPDATGPQIAKAQRDAAMLAAVDDLRAAHHLPPVAVAKDAERSLDDRIADAVARALGTASSAAQAPPRSAQAIRRDAAVLAAAGIWSPRAQHAAQQLPPAAVTKTKATPLEDRIAAAVAAAVAPLHRRVAELEETNVDTGVLLSGHVPGTHAPNMARGQATTAKAGLLKSAAASGDPGKQMDAVLGAIRSIHAGGHV